MEGGGLLLASRVAARDSKRLVTFVVGITVLAASVRKIAYPSQYYCICDTQLTEERMASGATLASGRPLDHKKHTNVVTV